VTDRYSLRAYGLTKILRSKYQDRYATHTSVEGLGKFQNSAPIESNAHTLLQAHKHQSSSVPQRSLLKLPIHRRKSEYPLCTQYVEEGRATTPVRGRCKIQPRIRIYPIGLHSLATNRFQKI